MSRLLRHLAAVALLWSASTSAFAAASTTPTQYQPDPALRTASRTEIESRVRRSCTATQAKLQNASASNLAGPCGCYATRTMRALDSGELEAFRATGFFNETARAKALAAVDACKLKRPV